VRSPPRSDGKADLALVSGKVLPHAGAARSVEAVAVAAGDVVAAGSDEQIRELVGPRTRVVDLRGRLVLPAFGDAHVHPVSGGFESLRCDLTGMRTRRSCLDAVGAYAEALPPDAWVVGGGWSMESFPGGVPEAADLDAVVGGRPAFLPNRDHHSAWVSTAALTLAGIDAGTPDPSGGRIERGPDGAPTGALHEDAMRLVAAFVPRPGPDELVLALLAGQATLHAVGITHFQDAAVGEADELGVPDTFDTYVRAVADGTLTAHVVGALWWDRHRGAAQVDDLLARHERAHRAAEVDPDGRQGAGTFRAAAVKIMVDGVCETFTAAMSSPYLDVHGNPTAHRGDLFIEPDELEDAVRRVVDAGFQVHFHAIGDRAVRVALDALEAVPADARAAGRHHLAHLQFIDPRDLGRFAALGAVANFQPLWACHEPQMDELTIPFVGDERAEWQYSIGSLARIGARVAFGSDWPVSSPDPLQEIHVAVNRTLSVREGRTGTRETTVPFLPGEGLSLREALAAFTLGVAYVNHEEDRLGVLAPGRRGDLVVLDRDILALPPSEIGTASVVMTVAGGEVVFGDD
jgi:predicted amidohydrolase YtcJ